MSNNFRLVAGFGLAIAAATMVSSAHAQQTDPKADPKDPKQNTAKPKDTSPPPRGPGQPSGPVKNSNDHRPDAGARQDQRQDQRKDPRQEQSIDRKREIDRRNVQENQPTPPRPPLPHVNSAPILKTLPDANKTPSPKNVAPVQGPSSPSIMTPPKTAVPTPPSPPSPGTFKSTAPIVPPTTASGVAGAKLALPPPPPQTGSAAPAFQPGFATAGPPAKALADVQKGRTQRVEDGGRRTIIQENDNRIIIKQDNRTIIRHDETQRFVRNASEVKSERRPDGTTQTMILRPGGVQLFNVVDNSGRLVRRYRRDGSGREFDIIDNRRFYRNLAIGVGVGVAIGAIALALRPPEVHIPRNLYIVDYDRASDDDIYEVFSAPPIERLERAYSLDEIRYSNELRERMRRLDLDGINFETGSWDVTPDQFPKLERAARIMRRIIDQRPAEVFLIEGHTDAVGSEEDNLSLSDRRAQSVAEILSSEFGVPPENLVTQGYGEQYLKIPTQAAERVNRRVAIRRITPLMSDNN